MAALAVVVTWLHLEFADELGTLRLDAGAADTPRRIEVSFVRELLPSAPAPVVAAPPRRAPPAAAPAASAPEAAAEPLPEPPPEAPPEAPPVLAQAEPPAAGASAATAPPESVATAPEAAPVPPNADVATPAAVPFEWPPSTRLSYTLNGNYRGPIEGSAKVEWLRSGLRYQVHLDVIVGPTFAPLMSRRMSSDGELGAAGLQPLRYDEETKIAWGTPRRATIRFEPERIMLQGERSVERPAGVQDTASQFVQMSWLFTMNPERLQPGHTVEMPLALPRRVGRWTYDVVGEEPLHTPFGTVVAVKLKPRLDSVRLGELSIETWFAPTLQYLPVRIVIRQDADTYVDLLIERLPQQADRLPPTSSPTPGPAQPPSRER